MKQKFILLSIVVFLTAALQAQFKVYSDGDIGIDATNPVSKFCINTDGYIGALSFFHNTNGATSPRTLQINQKAEGGKAYGLLAGIGSESGGTHLYGVYGCAYRGETPTSHYTFGVYCKKRTN